MFGQTVSCNLHFCSHAGVKYILNFPPEQYRETRTENNIGSEWFKIVVSLTICDIFGRKTNAGATTLRYILSIRYSSPSPALSRTNGVGTAADTVAEISGLGVAVTSWFWSECLCIVQF